ncbi:MAG: hypothetical protein ACT4NL_00615 [Pseudomarimonas sp.]
MKTAWPAATLGAVIALALLTTSTQAVGAEGKSDAGDAVESQETDRPAEAEAAGKPQPEDSASPPESSLAAAPAQADNDRGDAEGSKGEQEDEQEDAQKAETEEEDDEWDDGPYEDPLGFDDD